MKGTGNSTLLVIDKPWTMSFSGCSTAARYPGNNILPQQYAMRELRINFLALWKVRLTMTNSITMCFFPANMVLPFLILVGPFVSKRLYSFLCVRCLTIFEVQWQCLEISHTRMTISCLPGKRPFCSNNVMIDSLLGLLESESWSKSPIFPHRESADKPFILSWYGRWALEPIDGGFAILT